MFWPHIDTRPQPSSDLADPPSNAGGMYSVVVRDGRPVDQTRPLNQDLLVELWPELNLDRASSPRPRPTPSNRSIASCGARRNLPPAPRRC